MSICLLVEKVHETVDKCALSYTLHVGAGLAKKKRKCINVILTTDEFRRFQRFCRDGGYKKSTLIARLIRDHLDGQKFMMQSDLPLGRRDSET
jgi:hypothetical protein